MSMKIKHNHHLTGTYRSSFPDMSERYASSLSPKSSTVFFHAFSVTFSNGTPSFSLCTTHATAPVAVGSFLPFTALPVTNDSGFVEAGK